MRGLALTLAAARAQRAGAGWTPALVPEIAAGYWWHAANTSGSGAALRVIEGNGHATFDLLPTAAGAVPTVLTENGSVQFRMRNAADAAPSMLATAGNVQAGWTGATYVAGWVRLPDAGGDITGSSLLFRHGFSAGNQRIVGFGFSATGTDNVIMTVSANGTAANTARVTIATTSAWVWREFAFDPLLVLGGSVGADKTKIFANLSQLALTTSPAGVDTINDTNHPICVGCNGTTTVTPSIDTLDWASCYYANGIPSLGNRVALARYRAPLSI